MAAPRELRRDVGALPAEGRWRQRCGTGRRAASPLPPRDVTYLLALLVGGAGGALGVPGVQAGPLHVSLPHLCLVQQLLEAFQGRELPQLLHQLQRVQVAPLDVGAAPAERAARGMLKPPPRDPHPTRGAGLAPQNPCGAPQRQRERMSGGLPVASPRPSAAGRAPSQVACLILLGWDKGGQPAPRAPLPASSQGDYCPRANVLIAGRGCCSLAGPKAAGFGALLSGAGWRARLCRVLGYPQKGFFFSRCSAPDPLCPSSSGHAAQGRLPASPRFSLRQKGHRKKKKKANKPSPALRRGEEKAPSECGLWGEMQPNNS